MILAYVMFPTGGLFSIVYGWKFFENTETGNWRDLMLFTNFFGLITMFLSISIIRESPRYFLVKKKYKKALYEIDKML